ncbi:MAG TPA: phosphotransferase [Pseudonocardia sp.]|nr:phosphotransferase [Pseudonocardia sp.]
MRDDELAAWVSGVTRGGTTSLDRLAQGRSRVTYIARTASAGAYIVRFDTGQGPLSDTELTLRREATVYAALRGRGVPIPAIHGISPDGTALLLELIPDTCEVAGLPPRALDTLYDDYLDRLADLHRVDPGTLELPGLGRPADAAAAATLAELDLWERVFRRRTVRPWPVVELALRMLRRLRPTGSGPAVLCHGDIGPKNFMHDGRRVTALIDWEFAHVGDPMDDLAWWIFRGHEWLGGVGDLDRQLRRWSDRTGTPVDPGRLRFHRALVILRWLVIVAAALDNPTATLERAIYLALVSVTSTQLVRALGELDAVVLPAPIEPPPASAGPAREALAAFQEEIDTVVRPAVTEPQAALRLRLSPHYFAHLTASDSIGPQLQHDETRDLSRLLRRPVTSIAAGHRDLAGLLRDDADIEHETLELLWRSSQRAALLWPATRPKALAPPPEVISRPPAGTRTAAW